MTQPETPAVATTAAQINTAIATDAAEMVETQMANEARTEIPAAAAETVAKPMPNKVQSAPEVAAVAVGRRNNASVGKGLGWLALLLSIVALAAAGYVWFQTTLPPRLADNQQALRLDRLAQVEQKLGQLAGLNQQVAQLMRRLNNSETGFLSQLSEVKNLVTTAETRLRQQIWTLRSEANQHRQKLDSQVAQSAEFRHDLGLMTGSINTLQQQLDGNANWWRLLAVEHLLVLANQRLQLGQDPLSALQAMLIAEQQLQQIDHRGLSAARQALSSEIDTLRQIKQIDFVGVSSTITRLSNRLGDLPLVDLSLVSAPPKAATNDNIASVGRRLLADLGSLVQVQKSGKAIVPITPELEQMIVAKGRLMLASAQIALLRFQPALLAERIAATASWVSANYDVSNAQTAGWLTQLNGLKQALPVAALPDISASLAALRSVIAAEG